MATLWHIQTKIFQLILKIKIGAIHRYVTKGYVNIYERSVFGYL